MLSRIAPLCLLLACNQRVQLDPPLEPDTRSVLLITSGLDGQTIDALDRGPDARLYLDLDRQDDIELHCLEYEVPLVELGIDPGPVALDQRGSVFPAQRRLHRTTVAGLDAGPWTLEERLPSPLQSARITRRTTQTCLEAGGCLRRYRPDLSGCVTPCPTPPMPEAPAPPEPPRFLPCPSGWASIELDGVTACEPYPGGRLICPSGEAHFPGTAGCAALGPPCPARFPTSLPTGKPIRYVDPSAPPGGDGSMATPFTTIVEAMAVDTVLALAIGDYDERFSLPVGADLIGACASGTRIAPVVPDLSAVITVSSGSGSLANLSVIGAGAGVLVFQGTLSFDGVEVTVPKVGGAGVRVDQGAVELRRTAIHGGFPAMAVSAGSMASLAQVTIEGSQRGLEILGDAVVRDSSVFDVEHEAIVGFSGSLRGERLALASAGYGVFLLGPIVVELDDLVIEDIREASLSPQRGAQLTARRVRFERYHGHGAFAADPGSRMDLSDVMARDPIGSSLQRGRAVEIGLSALGRLERAKVIRARELGVSAYDQAELELIDVEIRDTQGQNVTGMMGRGLEVAFGAALTLERVAIRAAHSQGLNLGEDSRTTATDLLVEGTLPRAADGAFGRGAEVFRGATLEGTRVATIGNRNLGFYAYDLGTSVELRDFLSARTSTSTCIDFHCNAGFNDGMAVSLGASADVDRFMILDNGLYGLRLVNDSRLTMKNGRISGQETGIQIVSSTYDLADLAEGVLIVDNPRPIEVLQED